jgi:hypothetical protein
MITILALLYLIVSPVAALKHDFDVQHDPRHLIGPVGVPFGFLPYGEFSLTVEDFSLVSDSPQKNLLEAGFWLQRFRSESSFQRFMSELRSNATGCAFDYFRHASGSDVYEPLGDIRQAQPNGLFLSMKDKTTWESSSIHYRFKAGEEGLYFLLYQVCSTNGKVPRAMSNFHLEFHFINYDSMSQPSYLTAGEMRLPLLYTLSAISFTVCAVLWRWNLQRIRQGMTAIIRTKEEQAIASTARPTIYAIHPIMSLLVWVKALTVWAEAIRFHTIKVTGHAEVWSVLYYILYFFRGVLFFTVILLIGTGWSFVKGVMQKQERLFIFFVIFLQMLNQLALVVLSKETEGERSFGNWNAILHLVDILCCCAVLLPIVWQVNSMEASLQSQDENNVSMEYRRYMLEKLKLFRTFYLLVIAYIYATRIVVFLVSSALDYRHLLLREAIVELTTLSFYVTTGLLFRPRVEDASIAEASSDAEDEGVALIQQESAAV